MVFKKAKLRTNLRLNVWKKYIGEMASSKCTIPWCRNQISIFDFHCSHNIPESKGGPKDINNLRPICKKCNLQMGRNWTIDLWSEFGYFKRMDKMNRILNSVVEEDASYAIDYVVPKHNKKQSVKRKIFDMLCRSSFKFEI